MQLRRRRWHPSDAPFLDIETTPYADGTINVRLIHVYAQPGDTLDEAREKRICHTLWEDDIEDNDVTITRTVRRLHNAAAFLKTHNCLRTAQQPRSWSFGPRRQRQLL